MKILWVNCNFLHPTTKGGQIRTLEMLKWLHRRHEIHYVSYFEPAHPEAVELSREYCTRAYPVEFANWDKKAAGFYFSALGNLLDSRPLVISRWTTEPMRAKLRALLAGEAFDLVVCDFLAPSANLDDLGNCVLFQHNVETAIWERHRDTATGVKKRYFGIQASRMARYEGEVCRKVAHVIAVSENDAARFRKDYGLDDVSWIPTGVDLDYFAPPAPSPAPREELVFIGSMDWMPNIDGMLWFSESVFPLIRKERPETTLAIVGRTPPASIQKLGEEPGITVTGTVPDVRPHLWGGRISIVPLRIGGGTRLKIYESVAARIPVVSTAIGAEGLDVRSPEHLRLADSPEAFTRACLDLLNDRQACRRMTDSAWTHVAARYGWDAVSHQFEAILNRFRRQP